MIRTYRDLTVWQRPMDLAENAYRLSRPSPPRKSTG